MCHKIRGHVTQGKLPRQQWQHWLLRPIPLLLHGLDSQAVVCQVQKYSTNIPHTSREIPKYCLVVAHPFKDSTWSLSSSSSASLNISLSDRIFFGQALLRERKEIYSFEASGDYVMDVAWSPVGRKKCPMCWVVYNMEKSICWNIQLFPCHQVAIPTPSMTFASFAQVHAALFASVEAGGSAQLWDLNSNTEVYFAISSHSSSDLFHSSTFVFQSLFLFRCLWPPVSQTKLTAWTRWVTILRIT